MKVKMYSLDRDTLIYFNNQNNFIFSPFEYISTRRGGGGGGGSLTLESGTGMCRGHDPFFFISGQSAFPSLPIYPQCASHVPPFSVFRKILHFQPCFGQNFSSQDGNFPNFCSQDPSFFKENPYPRPYFRKPV